MPHKLTEVLNEKVLREILDENTPIEQIVEQLFQKGQALSQAVTSRQYESWDEFNKAHKAGETELIELEGVSDIDGDDIAILRDCPMADEVKKLWVDDKPPDFHGKLIEDYMEQNPGSNALLHPGCIAHQVSRQLITSSLQVKGEKVLNFYQLACRSMATGKIVYDENGLKAVGMSHEKADKLIDGFGCLYALVRSAKTENADQSTPQETERCTPCQ